MWIHPGHVELLPNWTQLEIIRFWGEPGKFLEFWNVFEMALDKNPCVTEIKKISFLKTLVSGAAAITISGFYLEKIIIRRLYRF